MVPNTVEWNRRSVEKIDTAIAIVIQDDMRTIHLGYLKNNCGLNTVSEIYWIGKEHLKCIEEETEEWSFVEDLCVWQFLESISL